MPITQRGATTNASNANATTLAVNKPTGVQPGDVLLALVTGFGTASLAGWTVLGHGTGQTDAFDGTWLYRVADGSETSTFSFTISTGPSPVIITCTAWMGVVRSSPIGGSAFAGSGAAVEPLSSGACTNVPTGLPFYSRSMTMTSSGTVATFTESAGTELDDRGIWSGGTVAYSHVVIVGTEGPGNPAAINITCNQTETENVVASFVLRTAPVGREIQQQAVQRSTFY